jgi:transketolase
MMRAIPNMTVIQPADDVEAELATREIAKINGPVYLRTGRAKVQTVHKESYKFRIGKADVIRKGKDVSIFATGALVSEAMKAAELLDKKGINAEVINIHTLKPIDKEVIINSVKKTGKVITCEDHSVLGGLGTIIEEVLSENYPCKVTKIGLTTFGESGKPRELYEKYGLTSENIFRAVI